MKKIKLWLCGRCGKSTLTRGYTDDVSYLCGICYDLWVNARQHGSTVTFAQWSHAAGL